jgi:hypothetical protein
MIFISMPRIPGERTNLGDESIRVAFIVTSVQPTREASSKERLTALRNSDARRHLTKGFKAFQVILFRVLKRPG